MHLLMTHSASRRSVNLKRSCILNLRILAIRCLNELSTMRQLLRRLVLMANILLACANCVAQPPVTFRVERREVSVELIATDRHHRPVMDLTKGELKLNVLHSGGSADSRDILSFRILVRVNSNGVSSHQFEERRLAVEPSCPPSRSYYLLTFNPHEEDWISGYHKIQITSTRPDVSLSYRSEYYVGETAPSAKILDPAELNSFLVQASCLHSSTPLSLHLPANIERTVSGTIKISLVIPTGDFSLISLSSTSRHVQLDYGVCALKDSGEPLHFWQSVLNANFSAEEYAKLSDQGLVDKMLLEIPHNTALLRIVARDRSTGNVGSTEVVTGTIGQIMPLAANDQRPPDTENSLMRSDVSSRNPPQGPIGSFGSVIPKQGALCGEVYDLPSGTVKLPNFWDLTPIGVLYSYTVDVPDQLITGTAGLPGVTKKLSDFGIDYSGGFWVSKSGDYRFKLLADDGARLIVDDQRIIDLDGTHFLSAFAEGHIRLEIGWHTIEIPYFQGPLNAVALSLLVKSPGSDYESFDVRRFLPPSDTIQTHAISSQKAHPN